MNQSDGINITHTCSTDEGSSGSPILNLDTNKVIGIHCGYINENDEILNKGFFLKVPLNDFIEKINNESNSINNNTLMYKDSFLNESNSLQNNIQSHNNLNKKNKLNIILTEPNEKLENNKNPFFPTENQYLTTIY